MDEPLALDAELTGRAAAPCSPAFRLMNAARAIISIGGLASWLIKTSVDSRPTYVSSTPKKAGHRCARATVVGLTAADVV